MSRQISISTLATSFLLLLLVAPAGAAPALQLQSRANYDLAAQLTTIESCSSSNATVAAIACGFLFAQPVFATVQITDDHVCSTGAAACKFVPSNVTIAVGATVQWSYNGSLYHTVTSDSVNSSGSFFLGFSPPQFFGSHTFSSAGNFSYHCAIHSWMTGTVSVIVPPTPPPKIQTFRLNGTVGWAVVGLDDDALLSINHAVSVFNASATPLKMLFSESGIAEENVELSTRLSSAGAANSFQSFPYVVGFPGYGYGYGNDPFGQFRVIYPPFYFPQKIYTIWWVNGPLQMGSNVQVLTGYASVRDQTSLNIAGGTWDAWVVQSQFVEKYAQPVPASPAPGPIPIGPGQFQYPQYYITNSTNAVNLKLDYGKKSDLLLKAAADTSNYNEQVTVYPPGSFIYGPFSQFRVSTEVRVTRARSTSLQVTLQLASTNPTTLDLNARMTPPPTEEPSPPPAENTVPPTTDGTTPPTGGSPPGNIQAALSPLVYGIAGVAAALLVSGGVAVAMRSRRKNQHTPEVSGLPPTAQ